MNFFEAQREARRDSVHLLLLFALVCAVTAVSTGFMVSVAITRMPHSPLFLPVTLCTLGAVGAASLLRYVALGDGSDIARRLGGVNISVHTAVPAERKLLNVVEEMAIAAGCPVPRVFVIPNDMSINAFAAGRDLQSSVIGVTQGAMESLGRNELQGVIAHEMSHILFADTLLNQRIAGAVFGLFMITRLGEELLHGRSTVSRRGKGSGVLGGGLVLVGSFGWFFGRVLQAAISRKRETLADAASAQFTRNPESLARALVKSERRLENYMKPAGLEFSHLFFASISGISFLDSILATHPSVSERVSKLLPALNGARLERWMLEQGAKQKSAVREESALPAAGAAEPGGLGRLVAVTAGALGQVNVAVAHDRLLALRNTVQEIFEKEGGHENILRALQRICSEVPEAGADQPLRNLLASGPENFLTLLQLTLHGLRELPAEKRRALAEEMQKKVLEDRRLRPKELLLVAFCRTYLVDVKVKGSVDDCVVRWLSFLSALTPDGRWSRTPQNAQTARLALNSMQIQRPLDDSADMAALLDGIVRLAGTSMKYKQRLVSAMWACLSADRSKVSEESELIRGFCILLQVPVPPLLS